jgi:hypothetical protein
MVLTHIGGGLGNQMFKYAAGHALALRLGTTHRLETSHIANDPNNRPYELGWFNISAKEATPLEKWLITRLIRPRIARAAAPLRKLGLPTEATVIFDPQQGFVRELESVTGHVWLRGGWESEKYFFAVADTIRREFTFRAEPNAVNRALIDQIESTESVSLHVRRGDKTLLTLPHHGVCSIEYYHAAVDRLLEKVPHPHFFIFSDDPEWAKANIKVKFPSTYISHNSGSQSPEDLRLMTHCKHFINAASTFSWWGAWLSRNPTKIIIAPKSWFISETFSMRDRIPEGWVQI